MLAISQEMSCMQNMPLSVGHSVFHNATINSHGQTSNNNDLNQHAARFDGFSALTSGSQQHGLPPHASLVSQQVAQPPPAPVEFNHAVSYVNKIKVCLFAHFFRLI